jgi:hypothetical protein
LAGALPGTSRVLICAESLPKKPFPALCPSTGALSFLDFIRIRHFHLAALIIKLN